MTFKPNFAERLIAILKQLGKERGLLLIFSAVDAGIAWADETVPDLSAEAIKRLDGAATTAPPAATEQESVRRRSNASAPALTPPCPPLRSKPDAPQGPDDDDRERHAITLTVMLSGPTTRKMTLPPETRRP